MTLSLNDFKNFFKYYNEEAHQIKAIETLYEALPEDLKAEVALWVKQYRNEATEALAGLSEEVLLDVPYYSQRDNYRDSDRTCFSSACAMALASVKPGSISGDDDYVRTVFSTGGDTTWASAQIKALSKYGVQASFSTTSRIEDIKRIIDRGVPVPVGILHKGPGGSPYGGGHWICVIGYNKNGFIVHDPWGEINHNTGTYITTDGAYLNYSYELFDSRWTVSSSSDGWLIEIASKEEREIVTKRALAHVWKLSLIHI